MNEPVSPNVLYYGRSQPLPPQIPLRAGPLSLIYEAGDLRTISLGNVEIWRRIYSAVRDHNWHTIAPVISNEHIETTENSFKISYDACHQQNEIDFFWQANISGQADGTITFTMRGEARSTFLRNRIGFCLLHPMNCAGVPAKIQHADGSLETATFPTAIAPQLLKNGRPQPVAPFDNLRALAHQPLPDLWAQVDLTGDIFEMEDQRNWTDASYKTYCTPLSLPFPVQIEAGTQVEQSIRLSLSGELPALSTVKNEPLTISFSAGDGKPLPALGLGTASHGQPLTSQEIERLKALCLSHLRVDLHLSDPAYKAKLRQATAEARALGVSLEIALFLSEAAQVELVELVAALPTIQPPIKHWLIFHIDEPTTTAVSLNLARRYLAEYDHSAPIGGGSNVYFTDINANRPPLADLDAVAYSLNPQVHAFDNSSLTETVAAQAETVASTRLFAAGKPIFVTPVTFKPRFNPHANGAEAAATPDQLPSPVDERQNSLYGLGWTIGSLKYLSEGGADSITYFETTGWRGIMAQARGSSLPHLFWEIPGGVYPLYHLFADVAEMANGHLLPIQSSQPLHVDGLMLENENGRLLLLTNFTAQPQTVWLPDLPSTIQIRRINETTVIEAMQSPEIFRERPLSTYPLENESHRLELLPFETIHICFTPPFTA